MDMRITPKRLFGEVLMPPSKSAMHRHLICASLCREASKIYPYSTSKDISATVSALNKIGAEITEDKDGYLVKPGGVFNFCEIDFCESGSSARFIIPIAAALGIGATFTGKGRLPERPMKPLCDLLRSHKVSVSSDNLPITIKGKMCSGLFEVPGDISSQYITGIMLAAPLMKSDTEIVLTSPLQSVGYVNVTIETMSKYGVSVEKTDKGYKIAAGQQYKPYKAKVEGDWSTAAFFMSAAAIGGDIRIKGLDFSSAQGDMAALDVFAAFGSDITLENDILHIKKGELHGITVNAENIPDMVPAIAATAAFAEGDTVIKGAERLRIKESDRIKTVVSALRSMSVCVTETEDGMIIHGGNVKGGKIDGANDHRIVMAFSVAAAYAEGESIVSGCEAVAKSYPEFYKSFKQLEGIADEIKCR